MGNKYFAYFSKQLDAQKVQNNDKYRKDRNPRRRRNRRIPKLQDSRRSTHIGWHHYGHCVPCKDTKNRARQLCSRFMLSILAIPTKIPPNSSPQRRLNKMRRMPNKPARPRHESRDLAGCVRDAQSDQAHESVSQQSACWACD